MAKFQPQLKQHGPLTEVHMVRLPAAFRTAPKQTIFSTRLLNRRIRKSFKNYRPAALTTVKQSTKVY